MTPDLWREALDLARKLPHAGAGKRSVRVTLMESGEYCATAQVNVTTGAGSVECACALATSEDEALTALVERLRGMR